MKGKILGLLAVGGLIGGPTSAHAIAMTLNATSLDASTSSFSILFQDTGNGLLEFQEITSFSGVTILGTFYSTIAGVASVAGVSTASGNTFIFGEHFWHFTSPSHSRGAGSGLYSYGLTSSVPEPGTLALLGLGLAALGLTRRRKTD